MHKILSNIPNVAWLSLLSVLLGALFSLFGVWISNKSNFKQLQMQLKHDKKIHNENIKRERLEELYILIGNWINYLLNQTICQLMIMQGKTNNEENNEQIIKIANGKKYDFNRLEMIMDIYAHDLKKPYHMLLKSRDELNKIAITYENTKKKGNINSEKFLTSFINEQMKIEELAQELKNKIAEYTKNL